MFKHELGTETAGWHYSYIDFENKKIIECDLNNRVRCFLFDAIMILKRETGDHISHNSNVFSVFECTLSTYCMHVCIKLWELWSPVSILRIILTYNYYGLLTSFLSKNLCIFSHHYFPRFCNVFISQSPTQVSYGDTWCPLSKAVVIVQFFVCYKLLCFEK